MGIEGINQLAVMAVMVYMAQNVYLNYMQTQNIVYFSINSHVCTNDLVDWLYYIANWSEHGCLHPVSFSGYDLLFFFQFQLFLLLKSQHTMQQMSGFLTLKTV